MFEWLCYLLFGLCFAFLGGVGVLFYLNYVGERMERSGQYSFKPLEPNESKLFSVPPMRITAECYRRQPPPPPQPQPQPRDSTDLGFPPGSTCISSNPGWNSEIPQGTTLGLASMTIQKPNLHQRRTRNSQGDGTSNSISSGNNFARTNRSYESAQNNGIWAQASQSQIALNGFNTAMPRPGFQFNFADNTIGLPSVNQGQRKGPPRHNYYGI